jgi:hypothetical protein
MSSLEEMIEPTPPARNVPISKAGSADDADGPSFFEPSLKIVSAEELKDSGLDEGRNGGPHVNFHLAKDVAGDGAEAAKPIHLEVHNTSGGAGRHSGAGAVPRELEPRAEDVKPKGGMLHTVPFRQTQLAKVDQESSSNPAFNIFANARMWRHDERNLNYSGEVAKLYRDVFTPTRPKRSYRDFTGRRETIEAIIEAVEEERSHVVLLGEKSIGKTSLLNIVSECAREAAISSRASPGRRISPSIILFSRSWSSFPPGSTRPR